MRDLFDEFLEELQRRQKGEAAPDDAAAQGERSGPEGDATGSTPEDAATPVTGEPDADEPSPAAAASDDDAEEPDGEAPPPGRDSEDTTDPRFEPVRIRSGRRRSSRAGGGRGPGGPDDGATLRNRFGRAGRRFVLVLVAVVLILLFTVAGSGLDLWTDAIWYRSVGFDAVFWTRLNAQLLLFGLGSAVGLVVLLGSLWIAGRLSPPAAAGGRGSLSSWLERLSEAGGSGNDRSLFGGGFGGPPGSGPRRRAPGGPFDPLDRGPRGRVVGGGPVGTLDMEELPDLTPIGRWLLVGLAILLALGVGAALAGRWDTILLWQHQTTFGTDPAQPMTDPVFGRDIGFFLFQLPFLRLVQSAVNGLLLATLFLTLGRYALAALRGSLAFTTPIRVHLGVLAGLYLVSVAAGYQLDKYELVYSSQGVAAGVSYTDFNARFFAFDALTVIAALAGALLVGGAFTRMLWPLGLAVGAWILATILLAGVYPQFVQRFTVEPNKFAEEQPYITNNIAMTRLAYGLDTWTTGDYAGDSPLTEATVQSEAATFQNARLWDPAPLGATLDQIQTVRTYYDFADVDTDRYQIGGQARQVLISGRELAQEKADISSWVNQRLTYTHGIGVAMVPVNEVTSEGLPRLLIRDLPPVSDPSAPTVTQPRIYFGERPSDYVIVGARQPEFDYPASGTAASGGTDQGTQTTWSGTTGIALDSTLTRLLFALRFRDLNLLISDQITSSSQLLMHRTLQDRVTRVAPFLSFDHDPYLMVDSTGNLFYIQDAYTTSDRFPNAQPFDASALPADSGLRGVDFNYLRNSVKVVMNAYDGTMTFYASDPSDPILRSYEGVFPSLFKPIDQMPADIRAHVRVPEDVFDVQTRMYARYHVTDPETFFRGFDLWTVPTTAGSQQTLPNEAYYVEMRMPGGASTEFLLLQPMVPTGRPNMIAWVAARNDAPNYGAVRVFRFPQDTAVRGPNQIEAQIDADPVISSQFTLWSQSGSNVVRGHLIVVPVQNSVVYLQPIYLQSTTSAFPAFQKIIVATSTKIVWGNTLADALQLLLAGGTGPSPSPGPTPSPGPSGSPSPSATPTGTPGTSPVPLPSGIPAPPAGDVAALVAYANLHFEQAQAALRAGDFARYGQEIAAVQAALSLLSQLVATPAPVSLPSPSAPSSPSSPGVSPSP